MRSANGGNSSISLESVLWRLSFFFPVIFYENRQVIGGNASNDDDHH